MHKCLLVPELLRTILAHATAVEKPTPEPLPPPTTYWPANLPRRETKAANPVAIALTCRTFLEPALDIIWHGIPCVDVLEACLPPPAAQDSSSWERLHYYADRVREFGLVNIKYTYLAQRNNSSILNRLVESKIQLFPNLITLCVQDKQILSVLDFFVAGKLKTIRLSSIYEYLDRQSPPLARIETLNCPSLRFFSISSCNFSPDEIVSLSKMIRHFTGVLHVHLDGRKEFPWSSDLIAHLSTLPSLQSISVAHATPDPSTLRAGFPALQSFSFVFPDTGTFFRRLASIESTELSKISAHIHGVAPSEDRAPIQLALLKIRDRLQAAPAAEVDLQENGIGIHSQPNALETPIISLEPLLDLHNLTSLTLRLHRLMEVDDALLQTMALAWPRLRKLSLSNCCAGPNDAKITLTGLLPLALHCRELEHCSLIIDADTIPENYLEQPARRCRNPVRYLDFGGSRVKNPYFVAAYLSDLFPQLKIVSGYHDNGGWRLVGQLIKMFCAVRRQERIDVGN
ncbi:hypothetical protein R3P38DRAFT_2728621 [Favolaschia claudopus]|uniref:F-box domain-containing protein n=1 Tax=Favolaschia claudopus TaxID=2862362 RepID=A0AAW0ABU6_9AGAR